MYNFNIINIKTHTNFLSCSQLGAAENVIYSKGKKHEEQNNSQELRKLNIYKLYTCRLQRHKTICMYT